MPDKAQNTVTEISAKHSKYLHAVAYLGFAQWGTEVPTQVD